MRDLCHTKSKREAAVSEHARWTRLVRTSARIVRVSGVSGQFAWSIRVPFSQWQFFKVWGINTLLTPSLTSLSRLSSNLNRPNPRKRLSHSLPLILE